MAEPILPTWSFLFLCFPFVACQGGKASDEVFVHPAASPVFKGRKRISFGTCTLSASFPSSSSSSVRSTARRCPVCRCPYALSQLSFLYGESWAAQSPRRSPSHTATPVGTPSKTEAREIAGGGRTRSAAARPAVSSAMAANGDSLDVGCPSSPSSPCASPATCCSPHKGGRAGSREEAEKANPDERGEEDRTPRSTKGTRQASEGALHIGSHCESVNQHGKIICLSSRSSDGVNSGEEREKCLQSTQEVRNGCGSRTVCGDAFLYCAKGSGEVSRQEASLDQLSSRLELHGRRVARPYLPPHSPPLCLCICPGTPSEDGGGCERSLQVRMSCCPDYGRGTPRC